MPVTYDPIATTTLGSTASTITFSSITSAYTDLRITFVGKAGSNDDFKLIFNGSSATDYARTDLYGEGTTASSTRAQGGADIRIAASDGLDANIAFCTIDIFSYANSLRKMSLITYSHDKNGSGYIYRQVARWNLLDPITSFRLQQTTNFAIGTTVTLYGIKNA
jgi:hypothetical protein